MSSVVKVLGFSATASAKSINIHQRRCQIEAPRLSRQLLKVNEITFNILHRFTTRADEMMMGFKISFHQKRGGVGAYFPQQSVFYEQPQIVVNRSQRDGWSPATNFSIDGFGRVMSRRSHNGLVNHLALMCSRQSTLPSEFPELFVSRGH